MIKKIILFTLFCVLTGGAYGIYLWNKPHATIGKPKFALSAQELSAAFANNEAEAMKKYVGSDDNIVEVSGIITSIQNDTSGISFNLKTDNPMLGVNCMLDKFTKQPRTDFKVGDVVLLKGICTGKLMDVNMDRCVMEY